MHLSQLSLTLSGYRSASGSSGPTFTAESVPTGIAYTASVTTAGDSLAAGVGTSSSAPDYRMFTQMAALASPAATLSRKEVSGMAFTAGATPIQTQITGQGATPLGANVQFFDGGLNQYNTSVNPDPAGQTWVADTITSIGTIVAAFTGGTGQQWTYAGTTAEVVSGPGMRYWSDWVALKRSLVTTYGAHIFDLRRALQFEGSQTASNVDYWAVYDFWGVPWTFMGGGSGSGAVWTSSVETDFATCTTATNNVAGIEAVAPAAGYTEGDYIQNINSAAVTGNNLYRKQGSAWVLIDTKHYSQYGYEIGAKRFHYLRLAFQGDGPPQATPSELFCAQDAAANTTVGTIYYQGNAPTSVGLFDMSGTAITTLSLTDNGSTDKMGSITVKRSASGTLTEGEQNLQVQLTDAKGTTHAPVDFRIGQASTVTAPRMKTLPNSTGTALPDSDFSIMGREVNGYSDSAVFHVSGWINPSDLSTNPYLVHHTKRGGGTVDFYLQITSTGGCKLLAHNAATTLILNNTAASVFVVNTPTWFAIDIDVSTSPATITGYYNRAGAGADVAMSFSAAPSGSTTLPFDTFVPRFFAARDASYANRKFAASDTNRNQYRGGFGCLITANGNIGVATAGNRRLLWNLDNSAVARAPYSTINGVTPIYDIWASPGDLLNGGFHATQLVHGTRRGVVGLT